MSSEGRRNIQYAFPWRRAAFFYALPAYLVFFLLAACVPSGEHEVNTDLFKDKQEMTARSSSLSPGMSKKDTFENLGIPESAFERMSLVDVQTSVYGNSVVQGTPEQLEQFRHRLMQLEGYSLPYRNIKSTSSLGFGKMTVARQGADLRLVLIFDKNRLIRSCVEGTQDVRQEEDRYMWDALLSRGLSAAF